MNSYDKRIAEARDALNLLGFDRERCNERSALVLLALLRLKPETPWEEATDPAIGTRAIMEWMRDHYGKDYAPNSRETIRRFTLHQFVEAMLVQENPGNPTRPVNSPKWCYQVTDQALNVVRSYGQAENVLAIDDYLAAAPGLRSQYAAARQLNRIPVVLPNGRVFDLSPGGQNPLIKQIVEDFCQYYTPGGRILYVGDADSKWAVFDSESLKDLGVSVDQHGKMPDLVVHMPEKNWLVLLEAASTHGPVDAKRHGELKQLFGASTAGLVFVSCFPTRAEMRGYLSQIAWETDVWCADNPTHLIHFNGDRFLGPY